MHWQSLVVKLWDTLYTYAWARIHAYTYIHLWRVEVISISVYIKEKRGWTSSESQLSNNGDSIEESSNAYSSCENRSHSVVHARGCLYARPRHKRKYIHIKIAATHVLRIEFLSIRVNLFLNDVTIDIRKIKFLRFHARYQTPLRFVSLYDRRKE